ncbi:MAG TPA: hypothetical protein VLW48_03430 [Candidatus Bathyarchaeia archaeon]|nr:hypothetical protein [Candidatus Bathyarchaeia archaeon]
MKKFLPALALLLLAACCVLQAQTLTNLTHAAPDGAEVQFLLTDGTVLVQGYQGQDWWKLTPDNTGSYVNGTWTQVASLASNYDPDAFASQVLADGRLLIEGGEYNFGQFTLTNIGALYDPAANTWTPMNPPPGWANIGDSPSTMLPNGHFLIGRKLDMQVADLDPSTLTWTLLGTSGKHDFNAEEGWTLMPGANGVVLTADVLDSPHAEHYIYTEQRWQDDGTTGVNLMGPPEEGCINYPGGVYCPPGEIGPAILRPDGSVFATGAYPPGGPTGHTSVYRPGANPDEAGTWTPGPDFPNGDDAGDNFAVLLPSGRVLVEGNSGRLYEYDGTHFTATLSTFGNPLILLPTGQVLVGGSQVYNSVGSGLQIWAPIVTNVPTSVTRGQTYRVIGRQFNGYSQAAGFGDEYETATNYPLVRIVNNATGHVFYAKTHGHSTMAVQTKNVPTYTNFDVPANMETGPSMLYVVANSFASNPVSITVQ